MPQVKRPKLVNRGASGLLNKLPRGNGDGSQAELQEGGQCPECCKLKGVKRTKHIRICPKHGITPSLRGNAVEIKKLKPDPNNARLHPERNMEAIKLSLLQFGQVKPIVVRKETMTVMAGNGTMDAALQLGWTRIAATIVSMTEVEAAAYGLADNKTAELATWDFEQVARIDKLMVEEGLTPVGWSLDELEVLRMQDWTPPPPEEFPEVDESIEVEHVCPKCGYAFSGGEVREVR